jgi:hypothetical protein
MKKEVAFFKDKRNKPNAKNIIKLFRFLGYTDTQIIEEMKKWKANGEASQPAQDDQRDTGMGFSPTGNTPPKG